jgi:hypothetical protein
VVERRIKQDRFPAIKSLDTVDFTAITGHGERIAADVSASCQQSGRQATTRSLRADRPARIASSKRVSALLVAQMHIFLQPAPLRDGVPSLSSGATPMSQAILLAIVVDHGLIQWLITEAWPV